MRLTSAALAALLVCSACASSQPSAEENTAQERVAEAERDSLQLVAQTQREEISVLADSIGTLQQSNSQPARRPAVPAARPPARNAPAKPAAPTMQGDPTRPEVPAVAFADTLTADELFLPASATLSPLGQAILDRVAFELGRQPATVRIRVEGHGDNTPPGPTIKDRWPSNWELSSARAAAAIRYLTTTGGLAPERFELAAFGDTRPIAANDTPQSRARNRRVIVTAQ